MTCVLPKQSKFYDILAKYPNIVTPTSRFECQPVNIQHTIFTNGETVKSKLLRMSPGTQEVVDEQFNEWLRDGITSRSDSPFASCLHVVSKKSGKHGVCVDYRRLNAISLFKAYAIPVFILYWIICTVVAYFL